MITYITKTSTGNIVTNHGPGLFAYMQAKAEAVELELVVVAKKTTYKLETLHDYTRKELVK